MATKDGYIAVVESHDTVLFVQRTQSATAGAEYRLMASAINRLKKLRRVKGEVRITILSADLTREVGAAKIKMR